MTRATVFTKFNADSTHWGTGGVKYVVQTPTGVLYLVFIDTADLDVKFIKSTDGGLSWGTATTIFTGTGNQLSIWYDRWSNISAGLIHCAYTETATDDTKYRSIDTESSDTLSSETTIFAGASTGTAGAALSITRARGGNLYCKVCIDAGVEGGFFRSTDVGGTWGSRTNTEALATQDQFILMPGWAADNQDIMCFFWDASADEISRYVNDDSANSWAETSIATTMVDVPPTGTATFPHFAAAVDITNSQNLLVAWSAVNTLNADLRVWKITESAITEVTNVITDSTNNQGLCAIAIDTGTQDWRVWYAGITGGTEVFNTAVRVFYKDSTDDGATWGSETEIGAGYLDLNSIYAAPRATLPTLALVTGSGTVAANPILINADITVSSGSGRNIQVNNPSLVS